MVMAGRGGGGSGGRERGAFCCCSADAAEQPLLAWLVRGSAGWRSHVTLDGSGAAVLRLSSSHIDSINASQTHIHVHGISELEAFSHSFKFYTRLRQSSSYKRRFILYIQPFTCFTVRSECGSQPPVSWGFNIEFSFQ